LEVVSEVGQLVKYAHTSHFKSPKSDTTTAQDQGHPKPSAECLFCRPYELVYQREPRPVEIQLGLEFVHNSPDFETVPQMFIPKQARPKINQKLEASFASIPTGERKPLTPWEKYALALLQANEAIFIN
jgi:hypothetical protein